MNKCPRCGTPLDTPWVWKLLFKITNPFGIRLFNSWDIKMDLDVNSTVNGILTDEVVNNALKNKTLENLPGFTVLKMYLTGETLRRLLDKALPDKVEKDIEFHKCWKCGLMGTSNIEAKIEEKK